MTWLVALTTVQHYRADCDKLRKQSCTTTHTQTTLAIAYRGLMFCDAKGRSEIPMESKTVRTWSSKKFRISTNISLSQKRYKIISANWNGNIADDLE